MASDGLPQTSLRTSWRVNIMETLTLPTFKYHFRAPGKPLEGPIRYAMGRTRLGMLLIGRSRRGICALFLGESEEDLRAQLTEAFFFVEQVESQQALQGEVDQIVAFIDKVDHVVAYIDEGMIEDIIDLDVGGTPFEQKVWQALCGIPAGQTRSYGELARQIGESEAARAVAGACAANVLAIVIPCHRVVRGNGAISGYRWGVERKRALLAEEAGL